MNHILLRLYALAAALLLLIPCLALFPATVSFADESGENIALGKPAYATQDKTHAFRLTDGKPDSFWSGNEIPLYAEVDLEENYMIDRVVVKLPMKESYVKSYAMAYNAYVSLDGVHFDRIGMMAEPEKATDEGFVFSLETPVEGRVVRVMSTMSGKGTTASTYISEIEVYGKASGSKVLPTAETIEIPSYDEWLLENTGFDLSTVKDKNGKYDVKDTYTKEDTLEALKGLVTRVLGASYVEWFDFEIGGKAKNGRDYYEISDKDGKIHIKGNEGVSCAAGLNHYLKYFCKVNISQETARVDMPDKIVPVGDKIYKDSPYEVRYTYNYCTLSYTMSYYGFDEWQRELDYLMLSGINVVLDTTATEALWVLYLQKFGYTLREAVEFVCGYTWKAWWLMGNLESTGGPVSYEWIVDTVEMARVNERYLAVMGADPCLQTFVGTLPTNFAAIAGKTLSKAGYDNIANYMTATGGWAGFVRPYALNTTYDGFDYLAKTFYDTQNYIYGRIGDYYAGDFLHEVDGNFNLDPSFDKANMSRTVLDKLIEENDKAVWIIQSWWANPLPEVVKGWGEDRENHVLLLDLSAVSGPRWTDRKNYGGYEFGGTSWCYCILENYGGRDGVHGSLTNLSRNMVKAQKTAEHMKGIGLTSEATERNPALFDFYWEQAWNDAALNATTWIKQYAERRCGTKDEAVEAWLMLLKSIYNTTSGVTIDYAVANYPQFGFSAKGGYSDVNFDRAMDLLISCYDEYAGNETYVYDLVELLMTRLSDYATPMVRKMYNAATAGDYEKFHAIKTKYLQTMMLLDELAAFERHQTLGNWVGRIDTWINDPRTDSYSDFDRDLMILDGVMLITNWSTLDLNNYANREYNGLIEDYYYRMWNTYLRKAEMKVQEGTSFTTADNMGMNANQTFYNYARQIALDLMAGSKQYLSRVPVEGDSTHRSLKEVLTDIQENFRKDAAFTPNGASLKEDATLEIQNGELTGSAKANLAEDLGAQFETLTGGYVGFIYELKDEDLAGLSEKAKKEALKPENRIIAPANPVEKGMKVVIVEDDGSIFDVLDLVVGGSRSPAKPSIRALLTRQSSAARRWTRPISITA